MHSNAIIYTSLDCISIKASLYVKTIGTKDLPHFRFAWFQHLGCYMLLPCCAMLETENILVLQAVMLSIDDHKISLNISGGNVTAGCIDLQIRVLYMLWVPDFEDKQSVSVRWVFVNVRNFRWLQGLRFLWAYDSNSSPSGSSAHCKPEGCWWFGIWFQKSELQNTKPNHLM